MNTVNRNDGYIDPKQYSDRRRMGQENLFSIPYDLM